MYNLSHILFTGIEPTRRTPGLRIAGSPRGNARRPANRSATRNEPEEALHPLMEWVLGQAGVRPAAYRSAAMRRRVPACLRQLRVASADAARELLSRQPELLPLVLNTALIGVSGFFRDRPVFDYLEQHVLPELLSTRAGVRVCSAGVSGGQEIYSLAMLLAEAGVLEQSRLLGVDCRAEAIRSAAAGRFDANELDGVAPRRRERFFRPATGGWVVTPEIKDRIRWRIQDLLELDSGESCELILFRNVAIYFNEAHCAEAWTRLCGQLVPGGFLITGKAEKPPGSLPLIRVAPSIYQKQGGTRC